MKERQYDLEERLLEYAANIIRLVAQRNADDSSLTSNSPVRARDSGIPLNVER